MSQRGIGPPDKRYIAFKIKSTCVNQDRPDRFLLPRKIRHHDLEVRRRTQLAQILTGLRDSAIRGNDGAVTWIVPTLTSKGWLPSRVGVDLYGGLSGVALLLGAYVREIHAGRADPVAGIETLSDEVQGTLKLYDDAHKCRATRETRESTKIGAYVGLGSQIWTLLVLGEWNRNCNDEMERARRLALDMIGAVRHQGSDVLSGKAGAISVLLMLASRARDATFLDAAKRFGHELCESATFERGNAFWPNAAKWPKGLGGFSHGATGIGCPVGCEPAQHGVAEPTGAGLH
jgi:lantibiotic modifying enzyme